MSSAWGRIVATAAIVAHLALGSMLAAQAPEPPMPDFREVGPSAGAPVAPLQVAPPPKPASAAIGDATLEIGVEAVLELRLEGDSGYESLKLTLPEDQRRGLRLGTPERQGSVWKVPLIPLVSGERTLGPLEIRAQGAGGAPQSFEAPAIPLAVSAPIGEAGDPKDYGQVLEPPFNWVRAAVAAGLGILALAAVAAAVVYAVRRLRRPAMKAQIAAAPSRPPLEEAREALHELESLEVFRTRGPKPHYTHLSFLVRRYFERAYSFPALEMTEDEMIARLRRMQGRHAEAQSLCDVFASASLAKFAEGAVREEDAHHHIESVDLFLAGEESAQRMAAQGGEAA